MKVLVTGVKGQLGFDCANELIKRNHEVIGVDIQEMDITDLTSVESVIKAAAPDAVIHCAAWTAVDDAEDEDKKELVYKVNVIGTENIVKVCKEIDAKMIYISTDYVFDGQGETPWDEDCKDYAPLSVYGESKLGGELAVSENLEKYFIVRIAWVFGQNGNNFIKTMLNVGKRFERLTVVCDQIGTPTYTFDLARLLIDMVESDKYGYYHATNEGDYISWHQFAEEIFRQAAELGYEKYQKENLEVAPVTTKEYGVSKATRPFNSRLSRKKLVANGFEPLPDWKDAVARYIKDLEF